MKEDIKRLLVVVDDYAMTEWSIVDDIMSERDRPRTSRLKIIIVMSFVDLMAKIRYESYTAEYWRPDLVNNFSEIQPRSTAFVYNPVPMIRTSTYACLLPVYQRNNSKNDKRPWPTTARNNNNNHHHRHKSKQLDVHGNHLPTILYHSQSVVVS